MSRIILAVVALIALIAVSTPAQVGSVSMNDNWILPAPTISDAEVFAIEQLGQNYIAARYLRTASLPLPNCDIRSLQAIHPNDKPLVQQLCYDSNYRNARVQSMFLAQLVAKTKKVNYRGKIVLAYGK
jgi:hypothetical protein